MRGCMLARVDPILGVDHVTGAAAYLTSQYLTFKKSKKLRKKIKKEIVLGEPEFEVSLSLLILN